MSDLLPPLPKALPALPRSRKATPREILAAFLRGRNEETLKAYRRDWEDFAAFLELNSSEEACAYLLSLDQGDANAVALGYRSSLVERRLKVATVNRRLAAVKSLVKLARMLGVCAFQLDVAALPHEKYRDTRGPGREGFLQLLEELGHRTDEKASRDRAILRLLYDAALRRGEVSSLDLEHVDLTRQELWVLGKGRQGERQRVTLPEETRDALAAWVKRRGFEPGPLFTNLDHPTERGRLSGTGIYLMVRELGARAGLKVRPHGLRHAAITEALDLTGGNVREVSRFSRHKDIRVLCQYDDARIDTGGEIAKLVAKHARERRR